MSITTVISTEPTLSADSKQEARRTALPGVCEGCKEDVTQLHGSGFCPKCRNNTEAGKAAMLIFNKAKNTKNWQQGKKREREKKENDPEWNKNRLAKKKQRRLTVKTKHPEEYRRRMNKYKRKRQDLKNNNHEAYQLLLNKEKAKDEKRKRDTDVSFIEFIKLHRPCCTHEGCNISIPCLIQFNHIDPAKKNFNLSVNEFEKHKYGTTEKWNEEMKSRGFVCFSSCRCYVFPRSRTHRLSQR